MSRQVSNGEEAGQAREGKAAHPSERQTKEERQHCRGETAGERGELRARAAALDLSARSSESPRIVSQLAPAGRCRSRPETVVLRGIVERRASVVLCRPQLFFCRLALRFADAFVGHGWAWQWDLRQKAASSEASTTCEAGADWRAGAPAFARAERRRAPRPR